MTVSINPPKTPVTKGSSGVAAATTPNVCKMPGPPAPFVPAPLPNIGKSGDSPKGYSKSVTIEGNAVAIKGASFGSMGDIASKATGGGLISANTHGPTKFVGPGSMDVKIEGKNVQLLGDQMLNNCGPSGSPPNSATMAGEIQMPGALANVLDTENEHTKCKGPGSHQWEAKEAGNKPRMDQKINEAKADPKKGIQFEGKAAEHNKASGDLTRTSQLSGDTDEQKVMWVCGVCGFKREGDQLHDGSPPGSAPIAVEVKNKPKLGASDLRQLGRNIQAVGQGGASGLIYKLPAGAKGDYAAGQVAAAGKALGCPIRVIRI